MYQQPYRQKVKQSCKINCLVVFINEHAHYCFETAANLLGIGAKNVIKVKAAEDGRMLPHELGKAIAQALQSGQKPFFVAATCATTLPGAYDPIDEIADISRKYFRQLKLTAIDKGSA